MDDEKGRGGHMNGLGHNEEADNRGGKVVSLRERARKLSGIGVWEQGSANPPQKVLLGERGEGSIALNEGIGANLKWTERQI